MVVWGSNTNTGGRYDPSSDTWTPTSTSGAPTARYGHTAIWTGSSMIVWGGVIGAYPDDSATPTGGRYDPVTNTWSPTSTSNAPEGRLNHTAVWTGSEMLTSSLRYAVLETSRGEVGAPKALASTSGHALHALRSQVRKRLN